MTARCARRGCNKPLPGTAVKNLDPWCSRPCAEAHHGLSQAADVSPGTRSGWQHNALAGKPVPRTVLQREAALRDEHARGREGVS